jgi:hypothetical protein
MSPLLPFNRSIVPVLYVGHDLSESTDRLMHSNRIGIVMADTPQRARRFLSHFRVAAIVFAAPDLPGLASVSDGSTPIIVLAARDAECALDGVTILRRETDPEDLAAVIHDLVANRLALHSQRDAA